MHVTFDRKHAYPIIATPAEQAWLQKTLRFYNAKTDAQLRTQTMGANGILRFPRGLTQFVRNRAARDRINLKLIDIRPEPLPLDWRALDDFGAHLGMEQRDYQPEAVRTFFRETFGIIEAGTAAGKTTIMSQIVSVAGQDRWIIFAKVGNLLMQLAEKVSAMISEKVGLVGTFTKGGRATFKTGRVTFVTFDGARALLRKKDPAFLALLRDCTGVLIDEVHDSGAPTYHSVLERIENAHYWGGLSATPLVRADGTDVLVVAMTGNIIFEIRQRQLIDEGYTSEPLIEVHPYRHQRTMESLMKSRGRGGLTRKRKNSVAMNPERNRMIAEFIRECPKPMMVFCTFTAHMYALVGIVGKDATCKVVHGKNASPSARAELAKSLQQGKFDVLISNETMGTGIDVPNVETVLLGHVERSPRRLMQWLGRGSRRTSTKKTFRLIDIGDVGMFDSQIEERLVCYVEQGFKVRVLGELGCARVEGVTYESA